MGATVSCHRLSPAIMQDFAETSNLTLDELQEEYKEWQNKHPSGYVDKKSFKKYMGKVLPSKSSDDIEYVHNKTATINIEY